MGNLEFGSERDRNPLLPKNKRKVIVLWGRERVGREGGREREHMEMVREASCWTFN
ncbi:hypothetical protein LguiB_005727 [Lonicera macranthoides]